MANEELCKSLEEQLREKWKEQDSQPVQSEENSQEDEGGEGEERIENE